MTQSERHKAMVQTGVRIGKHYSPGGKYLVQTLGPLLDDPASAVQLFPGNPQRYWGSKTTDEDRDTWLAHTEHLHKVVHSVYITNICDRPENRGHRMTMHSLVNQLNWCDRHGCQQFVFHPGSPKKENRDDALQWAFEAMKFVTTEYQGSCDILLENAAHPQKLGGNHKELVDLVSQIGDQRVGVCFDTTHAFAAGYSVAEIVDDIEAYSLSDGPLRLIHFNTPDQGVTRGSKLDRHSSTFDQGVFTMAELSRLYRACRHLPIIIEGTPNLPDDLVWLLKWEMELRETGELTEPKTSADLGDLFSLADDTPGESP